MGGVKDPLRAEATAIAVKRLRHAKSWLSHQRCVFGSVSPEQSPALARSWISSTSFAMGRRLALR